MKFLRFTHISFLMVLAIWFCSVGCQESSNSENTVQKSLNTLLNELQAATSGSNIEGLEHVIASANRIKPVSQSQTQSKNLLLSTAKEKLAQLKFQSLLAESTALSVNFRLAENQAIQVALLRRAANTLSHSTPQDGIQKSQEIASKQDPKLDHFNSRLLDANADLADQDSKSAASRDEAEQLREEADQLLNEAEDQGLLEGHSTYKSGVTAIRKSQQANLIAANIELRSQMHTKPMIDEAKAELEAIASILNGMQHTDALLQQLRDKTLQNVADFRKLADEIDAQTANTMNEAIALGNTLVIQWNELSNLVQDAMKGTGRTRGTSNEAQQTASIWKLDLEWTLGQVEEAKRTLLLEETRTLNALIEHGIVTTSSKWQELSVSITAEIEHATINAIGAYENAKRLASVAGVQGDAFVHQLDIRIAILQGEEIPLPIANDTTVIPSNPSTLGGGFANPQALINAFNVATDISAFNGTAPVEDLNKFYHSEDPKAAKVIAFLNSVLQTTGNMLIAIQNNMGEDAVNAFLASNPSASSSPVMTIDPTSIALIGDTEATAREVSGKPVKLSITAKGWKIIMSSQQDPEAVMAITMMTEMLTPLLEVMDVVIQQINDGQITSVDQINAAMMSAMENMNPF